MLSDFGTRPHIEARLFADSSHWRMSSSNSAHGRKIASKKISPKPQLKKHSHPANSWVKKAHVTHTYSVSRRSSSQRKLSHVQLFQLLPIPKGLPRDQFDCAVAAFRHDCIESSTHQKSFHDKAPPDALFSKLRVFDHVLISKTHVWIIAHML